MFGFVCKHGSTIIRFVLGFLSTDALETDIWMFANAFSFPHFMIQGGSHQETEVEIVEIMELMTI